VRQPLWHGLYLLEMLYLGIGAAAEATDLKETIASNTEEIAHLEATLADRDAVRTWFHVICLDVCC
jgi:hypothetical protein